MQNLLFFPNPGPKDRFSLCFRNFPQGPREQGSERKKKNSLKPRGLSSKEGLIGVREPQSLPPPGLESGDPDDPPLPAA